MPGWIGVDLDGTLARYDGWQGEEHIGEPIPAMVDRVKLWLAGGHPSGVRDVRIFTARVAGNNDVARITVARWCKEHLGVVLPVTNEKDYGMIELWDDRCVQVEKNTGRPSCEFHEGGIPAPPKPTTPGYVTVGIASPAQLLRITHDHFRRYRRR